MLNVIFFGSSDKSLPLIESLRNHFNLTLIVTRPDKAVGRKQILTPSAPKAFAEKHNIPYITPELKTEKETALAALAAAHPSIAIVADFGQIIPTDIFQLPAYQTLNIHFSKLPQYRGPSPVQYSILAGEKDAWISFIQMNESLDAGPIVLQKSYPISSFTTTGVLYQHLFEEAARLLPDVITGYIEGKYIPSAQHTTYNIPARNVTHSVAGGQHTKVITKDNACIPWNLLQKAVHGEDIPTEDRPPFLQQFPDTWPTVAERAIRAFSPWPIVWTTITVNNQEKRLKICKAHLNSHNHLRFLRVQLEGKKEVTWEQFVDAYPEITQ